MLIHKSPILNRNDIRVPIHIQNSFLYSGKLIVVSDLKDGVKETKSYIIGTSSQTSNAEMCTIEVAAGLDRHHDFIMVLTIVACIIGAMQMIRDLSKVGRWY